MSLGGCATLRSRLDTGTGSYLSVIIILLGTLSGGRWHPKNVLIVPTHATLKRWRFIHSVFQSIPRWADFLTPDTVAVHVTWVAHTCILRCVRYHLATVASRVLLSGPGSFLACRLWLPQFELASETSPVAHRDPGQDLRRDGDPALPEVGASAPSAASGAVHLSTCQARARPRAACRPRCLTAFCDC